MRYASAPNVLYVAALCLATTNAFPKTESHESKVIESFSNCLSKNGVPCGWHPTQSATHMFSIAEEGGNFFLRVDTNGGSTTIGKRARYSLDRFPCLSWRWRVHVLPEGARENLKRLNDSGAGVYVIFNGTLWLNKIIKYVWSTTLEAGTHTQSPHNSRVKVVVLRSGTDRLGEWITEHVDVRRDYIRLFGEEPPEVEAIALMSDADNTRSLARADYDEFRMGVCGTASMSSRQYLRPLLSGASEHGALGIP